MVCVLPLLNLILEVQDHGEFANRSGGTLHIKYSLQIDLAEECRVMPAVHA